MSTAWELLRAGSDAPIASSAWVCLNNLKTGSGEIITIPEVYMVCDLLEVTVKENTLDVSVVEQPVVEVSVENLEVDIYECPLQE